MKALSELDKNENFLVRANENEPIKDADIIIFSEDYDKVNELKEIVVKLDNGDEGYAFTYDKSQYTCHICNAFFNNSKNLLSHIEKQRHIRKYSAGVFPRANFSKIRKERTCVDEQIKEMLDLVVSLDNGDEGYIYTLNFDANMVNGFNCHVCKYSCMYLNVTRNRIIEHNCCKFHIEKLTAGIFPSQNFQKIKKREISGQKESYSSKVPNVEDQIIEVIELDSGDEKEVCTTTIKSTPQTLLDHICGQEHILAKENISSQEITSKLKEKQVRDAEAVKVITAPKDAAVQDENHKTTEAPDSLSTPKETVDTEENFEQFTDVNAVKVITAPKDGAEEDGNHKTTETPDSSFTPKESVHVEENIEKITDKLGEKHSIVGAAQGEKVQQRRQRRKKCPVASPPNPCNDSGSTKRTKHTYTFSRISPIRSRSSSTCATVQHFSFKTMETPSIEKEDSNFVGGKGKTSVLPLQTTENKIAIPKYRDNVAQKRKMHEQSSEISGRNPSKDKLEISANKRNDSTVALLEPADHTDIVSVLLLLTTLQNQLGSFAPRIRRFYTEAVALEKQNKEKAMALLDKEENFDFLSIVKVKLKGQLCAKMLSRDMIPVTRRAISAITALLEAHEKNKVGTMVSPVIFPGVGVVDKMAVARHIAAALIEEGKTDVTQEALEDFFNTVARLALREKEKNPESTTLNLQNLLSSVVKTYSIKAPRQESSTLYSRRECDENSSFSRKRKGNVLDEDNDHGCIVDGIDKAAGRDGKLVTKKKRLTDTVIADQKRTIVEEPADRTVTYAHNLMPRAEFQLVPPEKASLSTEETFSSVASSSAYMFTPKTSNVQLPASLQITINNVSSGVEPFN